MLLVHFRSRTGIIDVKPAAAACRRVLPFKRSRLNGNQLL